MMKEALKVIEAWGFTYKSIAFQWVKQNRSGNGYFFGLGRWTRGNTEPCLLAHELAHVAAGEAVEHGPEWKAAEEAIFQKYNEILDAKIPDEPVEVTVTPHEVGDGGILAMPLKANIPDPQRDDWKLVACPICGAECWENDLARQAMAAEPELRAACTTCALKAGVTTGGKH